MVCLMHVHERTSSLVLSNSEGGSSTVAADVTRPLFRVEFALAPNAPTIPGKDFVKQFIHSPEMRQR